MLFKVGSDLAGMMDAVVIADHRDNRGVRERPEHLVQQRDKIRGAAAAQPVHPGASSHLDRAEHGDLPVAARSRDIRPAARSVQWPARVAAGGRPDHGRSASPAAPSSLNRLIQRRTVAGWQSSSAAIWAGGKPCADSSAITTRVGCRPPPVQISLQLLDLAAWTFGEHADRAHTHHDLAGGRMMWQTSIQPPARLMSTPGIQHEW